MKFSVDKHEKYVVLRLDESRLTAENAPGLKSEFILLHADGYRNIVLDLSKVTACDDSQDLSCLLVGDRICKGAGGIFIVTHITGCISRLLDISSIDQSLNIAGNLSEAEDLIFMEEIEKELLGSFDQEI